MYRLQECHLLDLGLVDYLEALRLQNKIVSDVIAGRASHTLITCRHPHLITVNRRCKKENILASAAMFEEHGFDFYCAHRGGEVTYHGPGQVLLYPIIDLSSTKRDLSLFVRNLEETVIRALRNNFGLNARRTENMRGVWVGPHKVASIGLGVKKWVTYHGLALNVDVDKKYFSMIRPCGSDVSMASLNDFFDDGVSSEDVQSMLAHSFEEVFELQMSAGVEKW